MFVAEVVAELSLVVVLIVVVQGGLGFDGLVCLRHPAWFQLAAAAAAEDDADAIRGCCLVGLIAAADLKKYPAAGMTAFAVASLEN